MLNMKVRFDIQFIWSLHTAHHQPDSDTHLGSTLSRVVSFSADLQTFTTCYVRTKFVGYQLCVWAGQKARSVVLHKDDATSNGQKDTRRDGTLRQPHEEHPTRTDNLQDWNLTRYQLRQLPNWIVERKSLEMRCMKVDRAKGAGYVGLHGEKRSEVDMHGWMGHLLAKLDT
jgi:hypothetical protein